MKEGAAFRFVVSKPPEHLFATRSRSRGVSSEARYRVEGNHCRIDCRVGTVVDKLRENLVEESSLEASTGA